MKKAGPKLVWALGLGALLALLSVVWYAQTQEIPWIATLRPLPSRVPPAFYGGGIDKGTNQVQSALQLFAPSPATSYHGGLLPKQAYPDPTTCGRCHIGIHANWERTKHAVSASNPWYHKVKELLEFEQSSAATRLCAGCHAPIALMTGEVGLYSQESSTGVSCVFCHTLEANHAANGHYTSNPGRIRQYPGGDYLSPQTIEAAAHAVMSLPGIHKQDMSRPHYKSSQMCQSCHQLEIGGIAVQNTYQEWLDSSYAKEGVTCQSCHFTQGAGTSSPGHKVEHYPRSYPHVYKHLLGGGSTVNAPDPQTNLAVLQEAVGLDVKTNAGQLTVSVSNLKAGHHLPTGVGDLRQLWVEVTAWQGKNPIYTSGHLDTSGEFKTPPALLFHQVLGDAAGNPLVLHDVWRAKKILADTRLPAKASRSHRYSLPKYQRALVRLLWRDAPAEFSKRLNAPAPVQELARWETQQ
jgi:hypothetical protein